MLQVLTPRMCLLDPRAYQGCVIFVTKTLSFCLLGCWQSVFSYKNMLGIFKARCFRQEGKPSHVLSSLLLLCKSSCSNEVYLHNKIREVCIKVRSPPASLPFQGQATKQATKFPISVAGCLLQFFFWATFFN